MMESNSVNLIYEDELSRLYCGDCEQVMAQLIAEGVKVDKVITSPPYKIRRDLPDVKYDLYKDGMPNDQYIEWIIRLFRQFDAIMNPNGCVLWNMSYGGENSELLPLCISAIIEKTDFTIADILVWKKKSAIPNNVSPNKLTRICEFVFAFCRKSEFLTFKTNKRPVGKMPSGQTTYENMTNFFEAENNDGFTELNHSTFSSDFVFELIDRYVLPEDVVLDPFGGTGTTVVACEAKCIKSHCIELSNAQCEYAVKRIKSGIQLKLF